MATTKKKKVIVKKKTVADKKESRPVLVSTGPTDVFSTVEQHAVEVPRSAVLLIVNGSSKGTFDTGGKKLKEFCIERATHYGIRTFSVYVDGAKAGEKDAGKSLSSINKIELVAKDSRG